MPIYPYECEDGHKFTEIQHHSEEPLQHCTVITDSEAKNVNEGGFLPEAYCGALVKRLFGKVNFSFKGGSPTPKFHKRG